MKKKKDTYNTHTKKQKANESQMDSNNNAYDEEIK